MDNLLPPAEEHPKPARKPRKPRVPAPKPRQKAMITAVSALIIAATDFFLTLRYGLKLF